MVWRPSCQGLVQTYPSALLIAGVAPQRLGLRLESFSRVQTVFKLALCFFCVREHWVPSGRSSMKLVRANDFIASTTHKTQTILVCAVLRNSVRRMRTCVRIGSIAPMCGARCPGMRHWNSLPGAGLLVVAEHVAASAWRLASG